jgi:hypothetical protein
MGMTPFSDEFLGARVNGFLQLPAGKEGPATEGVVVNVTMQLVESAETVRPQVKQDIQRHLLGAITRRNNNIGESALWVDKPAGTISALQGELFTLQIHKLIQLTFSILQIDG